MSKSRLTWRKEPSEKGLARIGQGPRGADLRVGTSAVAHVRAARRDLGGSYYWYWYGSATELGIPHRNTASERRDWPNTDEGFEAAKADCQAYVERCLAAANVV